MLTPPASWRSVHLGVDRTPRLEFRGTRRRGKILDRSRSCRFCVFTFGSSTCSRPRRGSQARLQSPTSRLRWRNSSSRCCSAISSMRYPARFPLVSGRPRACSRRSIGAWVGFRLFIIIAAALVAWFADRLAHRRRNLVLADFFEHVLQLPLAYHASAHSGRQLKIMLTGTDTLWWLWVSVLPRAFRRVRLHRLSAARSTLALNWRLALPLLALCVAFTALTVLVMRQSRRHAARG